MTSGDRWLRDRGIAVLRVGAADVLREEHLESLLNHIAQMAAPSTAFGGPPPPLCGGGTRSIDVRDSRRATSPRRPRRGR